jgi:hypothetical protein
LSANPPIRKQTPTPGPWARSNKEKTDLFAEHLAAVFTPNVNIHNQEITDFLDNAQEMDEPATVLTPKEIKKEISYLNNKKAPGLDQISVKMLNELTKKGIAMLAYLFNTVLRLHSWPQHLKSCRNNSSVEA